MPSARYSKAVLIGVQNHGISPLDVTRITGMAQSQVQLVLREKASLTDSQLAAIEHATKLTAGQLAISSCDVSDSRLTSVINAWAALRDDQAETTPLAERA